MKLDEHPTVIRFRAEASVRESAIPPGPMDAKRLKAVFREAGADDVGLVEIDRPELADQKADILRLFPETKTVAAIVVRLNPDNIRCPNRAVSDLEFLEGFHAVNRAARRATVALAREGGRAVFPSSGFPMDMGRWPGKMWDVSHKSVAETAGVGVIGHHRLVIHPDSAPSSSWDRSSSTGRPRPATGLWTTTPAWTASSAFQSARWARCGRTDRSVSPTA